MLQYQLFIIMTRLFPDRLCPGLVKETGAGSHARRVGDMIRDCSIQLGSQEPVLKSVVVFEDSKTCNQRKMVGDERSSGP